MVNGKILILLFLIPFFLFGLAVFLIFIPLPGFFPPAGSHDRNLPIAILTGILGFAWAICLAAYLAYGYFSAGRVLDPIFTSRGLKGSSYMILGRKYQGQLEDRLVTVEYTPPGTLQKGLLNIRVETNLDLRLAIGLKRPLLDCTDCPPVDVSSLGLTKIQVFTTDPEWASRFLSEPANQAWIDPLLVENGDLVMRELYFQPGQLWLHARLPANFPIDRIETWFQAVMDLAKASGRTN